VIFFQRKIKVAAMEKMKITKGMGGIVEETI
jgi:hypothetical protein